MTQQRIATNWSNATDRLLGWRKRSDELGHLRGA